MCPVPAPCHDPPHYDTMHVEQCMWNMQGCEMSEGHVSSSDVQSILGIMGGVHAVMVHRVAGVHENDADMQGTRQDSRSTSAMSTSRYCPRCTRPPPTHRGHASHGAML